LIEDVDSQTTLQQLFTRPGTTGKTHIERHLATCDGEIDPAHGELWRRLLFNMARLAPLAVQAVADGVMFFAPDGRYRMQVFALEDKKDGLLTVYMPDVIEQAIAEEILVQTETGFGIPGLRTLAISVQQMDAQNTPDPAPHYKHMIGWNRKALRVTLNATDPSHPQVRTAEALAVLASTKWTATPPVAKA